MYALHKSVERIRFGVPGRIALTKFAAIARHIQRFKSSVSVRLRRGSVHRIGRGAPSVLVRVRIIYIVACAVPITSAGNIRSGARNRIVVYMCVGAANILRSLVLSPEGWDGSVRSIRTFQRFQQQMVQGTPLDRKSEPLELHLLLFFGVPA